MRSYTQLTQEQRYQIYALKKARFNQSEIAVEIGVHKSTISWEFGRNRGLRGYRPGQAHTLALDRRKNRYPGRITDSDWETVDRLIRLDWSPEQISARLALEDGSKISHEWIYQHVYADKSADGDLYRHLRCRKRRRKRYGSYDRRGQLKDRVSIDQRPEVVNKRERLGDWEDDTIIGVRHSGALLSVVERKSGLTLLGKLGRKTAEMVQDTATRLLDPYRDLVHTITNDNGKEFAAHQAIAKALDCDVYFAHPYSSWERGTNENTNGLIRQYIPKSRDFTTITEQAVSHVMNRLNHRPRKRLGFKTPYEVFFKMSTLLTVALQS